jgi:hypothetical protein
VPVIVELKSKFEVCPDAVGRPEPIAQMPMPVVAPDVAYNWLLKMSTFLKFVGWPVAVLLTWVNAEPLKYQAPPVLGDPLDAPVP